LVTIPLSVIHKCLDQLGSGLTNGVVSYAKAVKTILRFLVVSLRVQARFHECLRKYRKISPHLLRFLPHSGRRTRFFFDRRSHLLPRLLSRSPAAAGAPSACSLSAALRRPRCHDVRLTPPSRPPDAGSDQKSVPRPRPRRVRHGRARQPVVCRLVPSLCRTVRARRGPAVSVPARNHPTSAA